MMAVANVTGAHYAPASTCVPGRFERRQFRLMDRAVMIGVELIEPVARASRELARIDATIEIGVAHRDRLGIGEIAEARRTLTIGIGRLRRTVAASVVARGFGRVGSAVR